MLLAFDHLGVIIFAMTGCLVAAKHRLDIVGFVWLAIITAVGGGTLRDLILARPVFWIEHPIYIYLCLGTACFMYFMGHWIERQIKWLLWCDAMGLAVFAVIGTQIALQSNAVPIIAITMGVLTATFGGILRDLLAGEPTLIMRREIYVTAAACSSIIYLIGHLTAWDDNLSIPIAVGAGFILRALSLHYRLMLPGHRWLYEKNYIPPQPDRRQTP